MVGALRSSGALMWTVMLAVATRGGCSDTRTMSLAKTYTNCAWSYGQLLDYACPGHDASHVICSHRAENTSGNKTRITFIGDSITEAAKVGAYDSFPHKLQMKLGEKYAVTNLGVSGATMQIEGKTEGTCLASYMSTPQWQVALQTEADFIFILLGTNDAKPENWDPDRYRRDYLTMIKSISAKHPHSQILIGIPPPLLEDGKFGVSKSMMNEEVPLVIRKVAKEAGLAHEPVDMFPLFDFGEINSIDQALYLDGCHPNERGYEKMSSLLSEVFSPLSVATDEEDPSKETDHLVLSKLYENCAWNYGQLLDYNCPGHFDAPVTCSHRAEEAGTDKTRITFIGDSLTEAHNISAYDSFPHKLQLKLGEGYAITNLGVSGATVLRDGKAEGVCKASYTLSPQWRSALENEADVYFVLLGTNDAKPSNWDPVRYKRDYLAMLRSLSATHPHAQILIGIPPPLLIDGAGGVSKTLLNEEVPSVIQEVAEEAGLAHELVDLFPLFGGIEHVGIASAELYLDGCHPNERGYEKIATHLFQVFSPVTVPTISTTTTTDPSDGQEEGSALLSGVGRPSSLRILTLCLVVWALTRQ